MGRQPQMIDQERQSVGPTVPTGLLVRTYRIVVPLDSGAPNDKLREIREERAGSGRHGWQEAETGANTKPLLNADLLLD